MNPPDLSEHAAIGQTETKSKQPQAKLEKCTQIYMNK